jgi:two-component system, OmpR family, sensor histidine kinase KdpD
MKSDDRPDPDQILRAITRQEAAAPSGQLHIFFGMSAGVGKTYAMLEAARTRQAEGTDIVAGLVETHGRAETAALLSGLEVIPRKTLIYRDVTLAEMDLDAILKRRPQLVLVDELAHTNAPGSRHPKRWQDVVELLEAGIDVYSTLNVQHVDSRKATVESISGLTVRETVPDALLERAAQIELVDITPADLLKRLSEGKVYLGDKAEAAAANFFKEDRLTALRELALRLTAEKVDSDLNDLLAARGADAWRPSERLMVAVSHSPHSEGLIRATRRTAFSLDAPWIAVHVDTGIELGEEDRGTLACNLRLVQELGGELVSTADTDIAQALERVARQRRVTQLVVGRPTRRWRDFWKGGTLLDRLARSKAPCDILVLHPSGGVRPTQVSGGASQEAPIHWPPYLLVLVAVSAVSLVNYLCLPLLGYKAAGFVFLLSMLLLSLVVPLGAVLLAATLSALVWNYFFIPPLRTFHISDTEDTMMVLSYVVAAVVTGTLTHRIRTRGRLIRKREERTELLYGLARRLVAQSDISGAMRGLAEQVRTHLAGALDVMVAGRDGSLPRDAALNSVWLTSDKERAVALWAFEHKRRAGWSTDTLPMGTALYLPLVGPLGASVGVLAFKPERDLPLTQDDENLLSAIAHQLALSCERERLRAEVQHAEQMRESERLMQAVVDSVSHELRTPLAAIAGTASALATDQVASDVHRRRELTDELLATSERLNRVVGNLLDMSRFSAGAMSIQRDWHDVGDLLRAAQAATRQELKDHVVTVRHDEHLPLVRVDHRLLEQAVANLLSNAAMHTAPGTAVELAARSADGCLSISVSDRGPGFPESAIPSLFEKFFRAEGTPPGGVGLGLAITKAIVEAHGGSVRAANRPQGGACVTVSLPIESQPSVPAEADES